MKSVEQKLADDIANAVESHWFNPAVIARLLSNQPIYTMDRVMEMVAQIIRTISSRDVESDDVESEGVALAKELDKYIKLLQDEHNFDSIKLPSRDTYKVKRAEPIRQASFGWKEESNPFA
jgi:hypothetical protein